MKRIISLILAGVFCLSAAAAYAKSSTYKQGSLKASSYLNTLAFPGAEGGGRFASGGRGGSVYIVTTLEDYKTGEDPIPGSFRDAVSEDNRTIVFNVSGVIKLKERLPITNRKNLTIAGQTAPGDGITIYGYETNFSNSENIILRYMRFRAGAENVFDGDSMDAIWGRGMKNMIVDHVSTSWSTDETMSLYRGENMTIQWCTIAESLAMSGHTKGRHGYGAIMGGVNTTYHHNLIASHTSRNPRFGGGTPEADDNDHIALFDFRNNVIYNWGFNTAYGGGRSQMNYEYNYLKPGPGTRENVRERVIDAGEANKPGSFFVTGNYLVGNQEISDDNSKGIYVSDASAPFTEIVDTEFEMDAISEDAIKTEKPEEAYESVLAKAGATYPRRDALDARIVSEVKNGTGRFANTDKEVGGLPYTESVSRPANFDKDKDGIPDEWELSHGLDDWNPKDSVKVSKNGKYTNIEMYINSIVDMNYKPKNPEISMVSPKNHALYTTNDEIAVSVNVSDTDNIDKVVFYKNDVAVAEVNKAPFEAVLPPAKAGDYFISAKAYDRNGNQTQASAAEIHVSDSTQFYGYTKTDIGKTPIPATASVYTSGKSVTVGGSGKLKDNSDSCGFLYKTVNGDFDLTAKIDYIRPIDNHAFAGLMVRESVSPSSKAVALGLSHTKAYEWKEEINGKSQTFYRNAFGIYSVSRNENGGNINLIDENIDFLDSAKETGVALKKDIPFKDKDKYLGYYVRLKREGDEFTTYTSPDGKEWEQLDSKTVKMNSNVLVGFAADSNEVANALDNYNTAKFSEINMTVPQEQAQ